MNLTIHRGTNEIGGSCIELWNENTRIVLDFGMPLVDKDRNSFDFNSYKKMSIDELIKSSILPDIPGLYKDNSKKVDGLLISHAHADHYGLMNYIGSHVPVFMGEATRDIINISNIFTPQNIQIKNLHIFKNGQNFKIGDITVTPYLVDHSAYDSYLLLIECKNKRILYSGDFRGHGRKSYMMHRFIEHPPPNIDYLIMEGTQLGRNQVTSKSEEEIEKELLVRFNENKINLIFASGQNIDRLVSVFKACKKARKILVVDVYTAMVLKTLSKYGKFPYPSVSYNMKVLFAKYTSDKLENTNHKEILYEFKDFKISKQEINANPLDYVLVIRPSMLTDLKRMPNVENGNFIYSMWEGYKTKPDILKLLDYLKEKGFANYDIHTSGHADSNTLLKFANSVNPKNIIPIHTFNKAMYQSFFSQNIISLSDKEVLSFSN